MAIVSVREYAGMRKCSADNIRNKVSKGIISKRALVYTKGSKRYKINTEIAELDQEFYGDPYDSKPLSVQAEEAKRVTGNEEANETFDKYRKAKLSTEELKSRKLELEVASKEGRLLDAEQVRKRIGKLVTETKDAILNVPSKIAPMLVAITDPVEMETRLLQELNEALSNLSRLNV